MSCMNPFGSAVPTFQPFSPVKLSDFFERIRVAGLSEVIKIYEELENLGYNYASWAKGVATGKSVTGVSALDYLTGTALMGLAGDECRNLSQAQIDAIRLDMAKEGLHNSR